MFFTIIFCTFHSGSRPGVADFHDDLRKNELKGISDEVMIMVLRKNVKLNHAHPKLRELSPKSFFCDFG